MRSFQLGFAGIAAWILAVAMNSTALAKGPAPDVSGNGAGLATIALRELPKQGQDTYEKILAGGPFAYDKDGTVFGNREKVLPKQKRGYYREYTVKTPFSRDRGARRIVCGGLIAAKPDACFYTADHYASFRKIAPQ